MGGRGGGGGGGGLRHTFLKKTPGIVRLVNLPLEIPDKTKLELNPWKSHKIVLEYKPIGNSKVKNQDPQKFHEIFSWLPR